jgi:hypothetical protein
MCLRCSARYIVVKSIKTKEEEEEEDSGNSA